MGMNQIYGMYEKKTRHRGKLFNTIDVELNESFSNEKFVRTDSSTPVGTFFIGERHFDITLDEVRQIRDTMQQTLDTVEKKYKLGLLVK